MKADIQCNICFFIFTTIALYREEHVSLSRRFRGIKPVCELDLFHVHLDKLGFVFGKQGHARRRASHMTLPYYGNTKGSDITIYELYIFRFEVLTSILQFRTISECLDLCEKYNSDEYQKMGYGAVWKTAQERRKKCNFTNLKNG